MRRPLRIVARAAAAVLLAAQVVLAQDAQCIVPVELTGPLSSARFEALGTETKVALELRAGERRSISIPFGGGSLASLEPVAAAAALRVHVEPPEGSARVVKDEAVGPSAAPRGLTRRGLPPAAPARPQPDLARWMVLLGATLAVVGLRRRPALAAVIGAAAATVIWWLPATPTRADARRGLDGDLARGRWIEVRSAYESVTLPQDSAGWFALPSGAAPRWTVEADAWRLESAGGAVHASRAVSETPLDPAGGQPRDALDALWLRTADGRWIACGAWAPGDAFPPEPAERSSDAAGPPGWLAAGLPQGVRVLVGEPTAGAGYDWLRASGLPPFESDERR